MAREPAVWEALHIAALPPDVMSFDPRLGAQLQHVIINHVTGNTRASYNTAAKSFAQFCELRGRRPFPTCPFILSMWMLDMASLISVNSLLGMYMCGVKDVQIARGLAWELDGDPYIYRTARFIKKRYGLKPRLEKAPVTMASLVIMARRLAGWPHPRDMSHNDRLWVAASSIAIFGFLRGGEFLSSSKSDGRPHLEHQRVGLAASEAEPTIIIYLDRPKATWWEPMMEVRCYSPGPSCPVDPVKWLALYRGLSKIKFSSRSPAFVLEDGSTLSKQWMLRTTRARMREANISYYDRRGYPLLVRSSSWRCGGVESAKSADISDPVIKALGRWASDAWITYGSTTTNLDLRGAAQRMWEAADATFQHAPRDPGGGGLASTAATEATNTLPGLQSAVATQPVPHVVGGTLSTKWGTATIMRVFANGDLDCSWGTCTDTYRLKLSTGRIGIKPNVSEITTMYERYGQQLPTRYLWWGEYRLRPLSEPSKTPSSSHPAPLRS